VEIDLGLVTEQAFKKVPGWWPRAYISLLLFKDLKESNYVAPPYSLRRKCKEYGIGKSTLYKGLNTLINEGLIRKINSLYVLTVDGFKLLTILEEFEKMVRALTQHVGMDKLIEELDRVKDITITKLNDVKKTSFVENAITFVGSYIEIMKSLIREIIKVRKIDSMIPQL